MSHLPLSFFPFNDLDVVPVSPFPQLRGIYSLAFHSSGRLLACGFGDGQLQLLSFPALKAVPGGRRRAGAERLAALCFLEEPRGWLWRWERSRAIPGVSEDVF